MSEQELLNLYLGLGQAGHFVFLLLLGFGSRLAERCTYCLPSPTAR